MEMFLLGVVIIMCAVVLTFAGEIYLYISLLLGSFIKNIKKYISGK